MSVEGRTHKPLANQQQCNSCSVCYRACPAEPMVGLRKNEDNLCGLIYTENKSETSIASNLETTAPPCQLACPIDQDIREYIRLIALGRFQDALQVIFETNPLPLVCGYVCPRPCEKACVKGSLGDPVPIRALKLFVAENYESMKPLKIAQADNGIKVAIIGSGPAGLTAAFELAVTGHQVEIYESHSEPGGMLQWAIPDFRLPRKVLIKEIDRLESLGVIIHTDSRFGDDITFRDLENNGAKAVIIATGTTIGFGLNIANESNVIGLMDCLTFLNKIFDGETMDLGRKILVVGGGNAAIDTARKAKRMGMESVKIIYRRGQAEMPAEPAEVNQAFKEGVDFEFLTAPLEVITDNGVVKGLRCIKTMLVEDHKSDRLKPMVCADSEFDIAADTIISAVGQSADFEQVFKGLPVIPDWNSKSQLSDMKPFKKLPGLFTTGDFANGSSTVVEAMASGKRTAKGVIEFLQKPKD